MRLMDRDHEPLWNDIGGPDDSSILDDYWNREDQRLFESYARRECTAEGSDHWAERLIELAETIGESY